MLLQHSGGPTRIASRALVLYDYSGLSALSHHVQRGSAPENLCLKCGLCCDGTIFADVRLQQGDTPEQLQAQGLPLTVCRRKGPARYAEEKSSKPPLKQCKFPQPCAAFDGCRCRIYQARPTHCRTFECGVLKAVNEQRINSRTALRIINKTRGHAQSALAALHQFGDTDEHLPLAQRFRRTGRRLEAIGLDSSAAQIFGKLTLTMHDLSFLLNEAFYPGLSPHEC